VNDEARRNNQNLPGQGGIFNLVNLHVYHYAGNNPVKYVDPDGRAAQSFRYKGTYYFSYNDTITNAGVAFLTGNIPFGIGDKIWEIGGFKNIKSSDAIGVLGNTLSFLSSVAEQGGNIADALKIGKKVLDGIKSVGKFAGYISLAITVASSLSQFSKSNVADVALDTMINRLVRNWLSADSHEGLAALYFYAKGRINEMKSAGEVSYTYDKLGNIISSSYQPKKIDELKQELRALGEIINKETSE
jgi:hypothetical protein